MAETTSKLCDACGKTFGLDDLCGRIHVIIEGEVAAGCDHAVVDKDKTCYYRDGKEYTLCADCAKIAKDALEKLCVKYDENRENENVRGPYPHGILPFMR